jgi:hypothetical protein
MKLFKMTIEELSLKLLEKTDKDLSKLESLIKDYEKRKRKYKIKRTFLRNDGISNK